MVQVMSSTYPGVWSRLTWSHVAYARHWQHTPKWAPKVPSIQEQALAKLRPVGDGFCVMLLDKDVELLRKAILGEKS